MTKASQLPSAAPAKAKLFFPHLDGLRFISFFMVFVFHFYLTVAGFVKDTSPAFYKSFQFLFQYGNLGVSFFFVLSGFLITFLLIKERELTGSIHVGNFYVRRMLRIWPLYYLCLIIGFIAFPILKQLTGTSAQEVANPWYYLFLAANFDNIRLWPQNPDAISLSVLWSVTVEEQFYVTWPLILRFTPLKWQRWVFPLIMIVSLVFRSFHTSDSTADYAQRYFHTLSIMGDMALGGLVAWLCANELSFRDKISKLSKTTILLVYLLGTAFVLFKGQIFIYGWPIIFERLIIGAFFGFVIAEQNFSENSFYKIGRFKWITRLGTYTYGLYCLHLLAMYAVLLVAGKLSLDQSSPLVLVAEMVATLAVSIVIAFCSYHFFEKWFLKLKDKFAFITK